LKKRKIKVFVDGEVLVLSHFSGIGHYTAALLKAVDELLFDDKYSHITFEIGVPWRMIHNIGRFNFQNMAIRRMYTTPRVSNGLKKRGIQPPLDIFYGRRVYVFPNYSSWPLLYSKGVPIIYDASFILFPEHSDDENRIFLTSQTQKSADRSSRVITISENSKREITQYFNVSSDKIDVVYPVLDTDRFYRRSNSEVARIKAKYGIFGDYILYVGNLEPRKNLVGLLEAYGKLDKKIRDRYSLLLIGAKGWKDSEINDLMIDMRMGGAKIIQPTDYVHDKDLPALFSGAAVFAYVSVYEGFGIPPTESMACGTAVVSTYNSSLLEAVGDAAEKVVADDIDGIAKAIEKLLKNPDHREKLIKKGYEQVRSFNTKDIALTFLGSIEKASNENSN